MLAMNYRGPHRVRVDHKPMPEILHPQDVIVRVTRVGMTFGHEFTGVVEQLGEDVEKPKIGDHVLVPFNIACGKCVFCQQGLYGNCHESNPQPPRWAASSAIRIPRAATMADKRNACASRMLM